MIRFVIAWLMVSLSLVVQAQPSEKPAFSVKDMLALQRISDPQISPDGNYVLFTVRTPQLQDNSTRSQVWLAKLTGKREIRPLVDDYTSYQARWLPDSQTILFLSKSRGEPQIWRTSLANDKPQVVSEFPIGVDGFIVSPTGEHLALIFDIFPDCPELACTKERLSQKQQQKTSGQSYSQLFVRQWTQWRDGRLSQLFVAPLQRSEGNFTITKEPTRLTNNVAANIPSKPHGGIDEINFSHDGHKLFFSARLADAKEAWSTNFDLYEVNLNNRETIKNLTRDNPAWDAHPVVSSDGQWLVYLAMKHPGYESDQFHIVAVNLNDHSKRVLTSDWNLSVEKIAFGTDSRTLYITTQENGLNTLWSVDVMTAKRKKLLARTVSELAVGPDKLIVGLDDLKHPMELYQLSEQGRGLKQVTQLNHALLAERAMGDYTTFWFEGWAGELVEGYVVKPVNFDPKKRYPLAFLIHGGPQGNFGDRFHYRWNPQLFAGAGYATVMINFHGSKGYGQAFTDSIRGDWGGKPLTDLQRGLAAVLAQNPWIDGERACALGGSYGGFMVNWIASQWPQGFRCLVNHAGIFDNRMMYYSTEELWFPEWDQLGPYFSHSAYHERFNPVRFVDQWQTPMLVIHGALDYRVPYTQGLATFTALQRRGIPSQLLVFPDEGHWISKPANVVQWYDQTLAWMSQWLQKS